jgi:flagellar basal-body rod protein FlgB
MDLTNLPLFRMVHARMQWGAQRQRVLAQNVSNINTPEYRGRDVREPDFRELMTRQDSLTQHRRNPADVAAVRTDPNHLPGTLPGPDPNQTSEQRHSFETTLDDNNVVLEEQMQKLGETKSRYMMAASLFQRNMAMLQTAIKPNR